MSVAPLGIRIEKKCLPVTTASSLISAAALSMVLIRIVAIVSLLEGKLKCIWN